MRDISISKFKASYFALIERVHQTGEPLRITRRGRAPVDLVPLRHDRPRKFVLGDMAGTAEIVGDIVSPVLEEL